MTMTCICTSYSVEELDWSHHCHTTASQSNRSLGVLRRHLKGWSTQVRSTAYKAFILPQLESLLWSSAPILRNWHRHPRFVLGDYNWGISVTAMLENLRWYSDTAELSHAQLSCIKLHTTSLTCQIQALFLLSQSLARHVAHASPFAWIPVCSWRQINFFPSHSP